MLRYLLPRLATVLLLGFLGIYFLYREYDDPWLTGGLLGGAPEPRETPPPPIPADPPTPALPEPEVDLERRLLETHAVLATAMEQRLANRLEAVHGQYEARSDAVRQSQAVVGEIAERLRQEHLAVAADLNRTMATIEDELAEFDRATDDLDTARDAWSHAFRELSAIGEISGDALNEANYRFETYQVGANETLAQVARNVERTYGLVGTDPRTLIELFNDIDTRLRGATGRRSPARVVANSTLRVPIPLGAGGMIDNAGISGILMHQRAAINRARDRQTRFSGAIREQVAEVRAFVERLERLEELTRDLQESLTALDPEDLSFLEETAGPEQLAAWERFNDAFDAYARTDSRELRGRGAERLEAATRDLIDAYAARSAIVIDQPGDASVDEDLEWFRSYLERYDPTPPGLRSIPERSIPEAENHDPDPSRLDDADWIDGLFEE